MSRNFEKSAESVASRARTGAGRLASRSEKDADGVLPGPGELGAPAKRSEIDGLLARMREGDRDAAAEFITRYGDRVRRRVRGKLSPAMRRVFDSQEILSTIGRRLDTYVHNGNLEAASVNQLWALVFRMTENAVIDKRRLHQRLRATEGGDSAFAQAFAERLRRAEAADPAGAEIEVEAALSSFEDSIDRQILSMWLTGTPHKTIALAIDRSHDATRRRWLAIRAELQRRYAGGG